MFTAFLRFSSSRALLTDNGPAVVADEVTEGLLQLGRRALIEPGKNDVAAGDSQRRDNELPPLLKRILEEYSATGMPPAYVPKQPHPKKEGEPS